MRKLFFLLLICSVIRTEAQTYTSGLTSTGSGSNTNVRLGGANPLLVNTTIDVGTFSFGIKKSTVNFFTILNNGNIGIGNISPTSLLHLNAGTAALNTAPLKFTSGVNLTTPEAGAMEYNGTALFFTPTTIRKEIAFADLSNISGTLGITRGGTGLTTLTTGDILFASAANTLSKLAVGTNGQVLTLAGGVPAWVAPYIGGTVTNVSALTFGTTGTDLTSTVATGTTTPVITLNVPTASASNRGALSSTDWSMFNSKEPAIAAPNSIIKYLNGYKQFVSFNTDSITEGSTNLYYSNARAQASITGTTNRITLTSGVADISSAYIGQTSISTLGTISAGTWNGTTIGANYGGTGQSTVTTGDLLYGSATNTWNKLGSGSNGQVLTVTSGIPSWVTPANNSGWGLSGNAGTAPGTNFIGTTDNKSLRFRTNNIESLVLDSVGNLNWTGNGTNAVDFFTPSSDGEYYGAGAIQKNEVAIYTSNGLKSKWPGARNSLVGADTLGAFMYSRNLQNFLIDATLYISPTGAELSRRIAGASHGLLFTDTSAILNVSSANQGIYIPRLTDAAMRAIVTPGNGLMVTNTDSANRIFIYNGSGWRGLSFTNENVTQWSTVTSGITFNGGNVGIGVSSLNTAFGGAALEVRQTGSSSGTWRGRIANGGDSASVILGEFNNQAWLGGHNSALNAWLDIHIQPGGAVNTIINENSGHTLIGATTDDGSNKLQVYGSTRLNGTLNVNNSSPSASAQVDISGGTTKGILIPRMTDANMRAISSPANGLMVTNTDSLNRIFIYNGSTWRGLTFTNEVAKGWGVKGNVGTNSGTNYIGTTDNASLAISTNGVTRATYDSLGNYDFESNTGKNFMAWTYPVTTTANPDGYGGLIIDTTESAIGVQRGAPYDMTIRTNLSGADTLGAFMYSQRLGSSIGTLLYAAPFGLDLRHSQGRRKYTPATDSSSIFNISSTTQGISIPRMNTTQMLAIITPSNGLMITNTDSANKIFLYTGSTWKGLAFTSDIVGGGGNTDTSLLVHKANTETITGRKYFTPDINVNGITVGRSGGNIQTNIAVGDSALASNITGISNTVTGSKSLALNTTGQYNVASGNLSLYNNVIGSYNTSLGFKSLYTLGSGGVGSGVSFHTAIGAFALGSFQYAQSNFQNTAIGYASSYSTTTGDGNTSVGGYSMFANTTGANNTAFGYWSLRFNTTGSENMGVGTTSLRENTTGNRNIGVGRETLRQNTTGSGNVALGYQAGYYNGGDYNILLGYQAGYNVLGSNKLYIANSSTSTPLIYGDFSKGYLSVNNSSTSPDTLNSVFSVYSTTKGMYMPRLTETQMLAIVSPAAGLMITNTDSLNRIFIYTGSAWKGLAYTSEGSSFSGWGLGGNAGTDTTTQFIGTKDDVALAFRTNNTTKLTIASSGNVGIGTTNTSDTAFKLFVETGIRTRKLKVDAAAIQWADYVFDKNYKLPTLTEVDKFIQQNKHLPGVQSTAEIEKNGIDVGENQAILLKKVEELTLYMIELNKKVELLAKENEALKKKVNSNNQ